MKLFKKIIIIKNKLKNYKNRFKLIKKIQEIIMLKICKVLKN